MIKTDWTVLLICQLKTKSKSFAEQEGIKTLKEKWLKLDGEHRANKKSTK